MTTYVFLVSPADLYLTVLILLFAGVLCGFGLVLLTWWLFDLPSPRRTGVRRSLTASALGRARVPHTGTTCPDLHSRTTADLVASADRARREVAQ